MEGNSVHPLLLRGVHDNAAGTHPFPSPAIVRMESWKDKKCGVDVSFLSFPSRFQSDRSDAPRVEWPREVSGIERSKTKARAGGPKLDRPDKGSIY